MQLFSSASLTALAVGLSSFVSVQALAQEASTQGDVSAQANDLVDETEPEYDSDTILVLGARLADQVDTVQPPILELDAEDIAAYGAGSIAELLQQLGPQVSSARGRGGGGFPILLVNGVRISSPRELRSYPPEAIEKFEVFPEEVALQYGYSPDQRVVNVILKDNFSSREIEVEYGQPFDGGFSSQEIEATYLRIDGPSRLNINLEWDNSSLLTEAERGVVQSSVPTFASDPDPAAYRSLRSDTAGLEGTLNWSTTLGAGNSLSVNATYERDDSLSLQGLDTVFLIDPVGDTALRSFNEGDPLTFDSRSQTWASASTLSLGLGDWDITGTVDGSFSKSRSMTQQNLDTSALVTAAAAGDLALDADLGTFAEAGFEEANTKSYSANSLVTARTQPLYLPAGDVTLTLNTGYQWNRIESIDTRNPGVETQLTRGRLVSGMNLGVPITSRADDFGSAVGDISLNLSAGLDHLSDFGTLYDWNAGITWGLTEKLTFNLSYVNRDAAPSLSQLGNPEIATFNVPVFDIANNETVLATVISGGNPALPAQNQSDWKIGVQWELPFLDNSRISVDYFRNSSTDVTSGFPALTAEIESAFADRITRDAGGTLLQIDQRPITFASTYQERLQFGLNLSGQISGNDDEGEARGNGNRGGGAGGAGAATGRPVGLAGGQLGGGQAPAQAAAQPDPERFAQMRATFCEADANALRRQFNQVIAAANAGEPAPVGEDGQPINLPPQMLQNLAGEDGVIDEAEFDIMRGRICDSDGPPPGAGNGTGGGAGFNPQMFQQMRTTFCSAEVRELVRRLTLVAQARARGEEPGEDALSIPPQMLDRLTNENGEIDAERVAALKERFCNGAGAAGGFGGPPAGAGAGGPPPSAGGGRGPGLPFGRGRGGSGGRWFLNLQYTLELENEAVIAAGIPVLDLLDGDGNQPRHAANFTLGTFYNGFGMFWQGNYTGSSTLAGSGQLGSTDLNFGDYFTLNVRAFADLGQRESLVEAVPFLAGSRIGIGIDNIFDARQRVTDDSGTVPLRYQPFLIDPEGRSFEIEFRKMF